MTEWVDIGRRADGERFRIPAPGHGLVHLLITGKSGSGKSGTVTAILADLAARPNIALFGIDLKGGVEQDPWRERFTHVATSDVEAADLATTLETVIDRRARLMSTVARERRGIVRMWEPEFGPWVVLALDEMASLKNKTAGCKAALAALDQIAAKGRAVGVNVIAATQKALVGDFPSTFLANFEGRMCHRMGTPLEYATALNVAQAELEAGGWHPIGTEPKDRGRFWVTGLTGVADMTLCRSVWWEDDALHAHITRCAPLRVPPEAVADVDRFGVAV